MAAQRKKRDESIVRVRGDMLLCFMKELKWEIKNGLKYGGNDFDKAILEARKVEQDINILEDGEGVEESKILFTPDQRL